MKCIICDKNFTDSWHHLFGKKDGLARFKTKTHADYLREIEKSDYTLPCYCGGHITIYVIGQDSWEVTCDDCGFLFDED